MGSIYVSLWLTSSSSLSCTTHLIFRSSFDLYSYIGIFLWSRLRIQVGIGNVHSPLTLIRALTLHISDSQNLFKNALHDLLTFYLWYSVWLCAISNSIHNTQVFSFSLRKHLFTNHLGTSLFWDHPFQEKFKRFFIIFFPNDLLNDLNGYFLMIIL